MLVKNDYVSKEKVVHVRENDNLKDVKKVFSVSGYRCIPVLDETGEKYVGNIYKVNLLRYESENSLDTPLDKALISDRDITNSVQEDDPFFKVFSTIRQLPYLAVVDEAKNFQGILTNGNVIQVLENAWGVHNGSYSLTIGTVEYQGALQQMLQIINEHCSVQSVITLNNDTQFVRRICIVLPENVDERTMKNVVNDLEEQKFTLTDIEKLN